MNYADIFEASSIVWPVAFLLMFLFVLRKVESQVSPVVTVVVNGVAKTAAANATACAIAIGYGLSACLSAFYDVFNQLDAKSMVDMSWHQYFALWAKVLNPFVVTVLAYAAKSGFQKPGTQPPFPTTT